MVLSWSPAEPALAASPPNVSAASSILVDIVDGRVLFEKNAQERRAIASTTKIMTALVVLEESKMTDVVTASPNAESVGATDGLLTEIELRAGEKMSVEDLLYALLLASANDAAVALAEHAGGTVEGFVQMMNSRAAAMGLKQTHFSNPSGVDDPGHYSTASDLSRIALAALERTEMSAIVGTRDRLIPGHETVPERQLRNRNQLLFSFPGANGVKTGQTRASGKSLVASAQRAGERRLSVVLSSSDPFADSSALLDYGFSSFKRFVLAEPGKVWGRVTLGDGTTRVIVGGKQVSVLLDAQGPSPSVRYDPTRRTLTAAVGDGMLVAPAKLSCPAEPCRDGRPDNSSLVTALFSVLAPAARLIARAVN